MSVANSEMPTISQLMPRPATKFVQVLLAAREVPADPDHSQRIQRDDSIIREAEPGAHGQGRHPFLSFHVLPQHLQAEIESQRGVRDARSHRRPSVNRTNKGRRLTPQSLGVVARRRLNLLPSSSCQMRQANPAQLSEPACRRRNREHLLTGWYGYRIVPSAPNWSSASAAVSSPPRPALMPRTPQCLTLAPHTCVRSTVAREMIMHPPPVA